MVHHGPLPRAAQTAALIGEHLTGAALRVAETAGDYVPCVTRREELPPDSADRLLRFLEGATERERVLGPSLVRRALEQFTGPVEGDQERHELVVTHNFLVGWLVSHAMDAPPWRWLSVRQANAALTVIRYAPGRPAEILVHNDMRHLPAELRWTGFPPGTRI